MTVFVKYDSEDEMNIEKLMKDKIDPELLARITSNNKIFKKAVTTWLTCLNERGFLDVVAKAE